MPVLRCSGTLLRKDGIVQPCKVFHCAAASSLAFCSCAALIGSSHVLSSVARLAVSPSLWQASALSKIGQLVFQNLLLTPFSQLACAGSSRGALSLRKLAGASANSAAPQGQFTCSPWHRHGFPFPK